MAAAQRLSAISSQLTSPSRGLVQGEVAIITGAAQGIGRATAILFAQHGAKVVVADLDEKKAQIVADEIRKSGGEAIAVGGDVTDKAFPKKIVKATVDAFGTINHLVNMAGFTFDKMIHTMGDDAIDLMLNVHNAAPLRLIRECAPYFRNKDPNNKAPRTIVNVSSTSGLHGNVGQANYAIAKAGVVGLTKTVAKEWGAFGVRCNTVAYGWITTRLTGAKELGETIIVNGQSVALGIPGAGRAATDSSVTAAPDIPLGRPGSPEEAAGAVLFLCSPLSAYISGHTLEVTGGRGI